MTTMQDDLHHFQCYWCGKNWVAEYEVKDREPNFKSAELGMGLSLLPIHLGVCADCLRYAND